MSTYAQPAPDTQDAATSVGKKPLPEYLPARMLNEFVYCPRLYFYEYVEKLFAPSVDTLEGQARHARTEADADSLPKPDAAAPERIHARSIELTSERLGLIAKMDVIESAPGCPDVVPVDYKKGRPRESDAGPEPWPADRVQIGAQVLVLRDNGYTVPEGVLYYVATKQRVTVVVDATLEQEIIAAIAAANQLAASGTIPPPLQDSPKCPRCSLVGICLPDETNALRARAETLAATPAAQQISLFPELASPAVDVRVRALVVPRDDQRPLFLNTQGWRAGKSGEVIQVKGPAEGKGRARADEIKQEVRMGEVSQVNIMGGVQLSSQLIQELCEAEIPICYFSQGGYFYGITNGINSRNVFLRRTQFLAAENPALALNISRRLVAGKIRNQRTLLQRNHASPPEEALRLLKALSFHAEAAPNIESLLGVEGAAARAYFQHFAGMLKPSTDPDEPGADPRVARFDFNGRNRRPPRDPVNALLSLAYSVLSKDLTITCYALGFEPFWGFYHQPRFGRPSLALDLMEPFRPLIADSTVLTAINNGMVSPGDFASAGNSVALTADGRRNFFRAYSARMDALVTHPLFDYRVSYRRMLEIQARLLARFLTGEIPEYPVFTTR